MHILTSVDVGNIEFDVAGEFVPGYKGDFYEPSYGDNIDELDILYNGKSFIGILNDNIVEYIMEQAIEKLRS